MAEGGNNEFKRGVPSLRPQANIYLNLTQGFPSHLNFIICSGESEEDDDDRVIAEMEKRLGLKKKSKAAIKKEFEADGLAGMWMRIYICVY